MNADARRALEAWLEPAGTALDAGQWKLLDLYVLAVLEHNARTNLCADREEPQLWLRHVADGLACVPLLRRRLASPSPELLDLGAGAGFVGISAKIAWPEARVVLMESSYRKFRFLSWICARLGLKGLGVLWRRGGAGGRADGGRDAVLARALAPLPESLRLAMPLARQDGGLFVSYQSAAPSLEDGALSKELRRSRAELETSEPYTLPGETRPRHLLIFRHSSEKPEPQGGLGDESA